jgi:hypothetical protein
VHHDVYAGRLVPGSLPGRDKQVNGIITVAIVESAEPAQPRCCQPGEHCAVPGSEDGRPQALRVCQLPGMGDDDATARLLPPAAGEPPTQRIARHKVEQRRDTRNLTLAAQQLVEVLMVFHSNCHGKTLAQ